MGVFQSAPASIVRDEEEELESLAQLLRTRRLTVFTGAGVSVAAPSSIPDFRSPGGLWSRYDPAVYCDYATFRRRPELFWEMALSLATEVHERNGGTVEELDAGELRRAAPNAAHEAIADLERAGALTCVVTQNIDGLHRRAGNADVVELHGSDQRTVCLACLTQDDTEAAVIPHWLAHRRKQRDGSSSPPPFVPRCRCGGVLKPDVTLFGEALPTGAYSTAVMRVLANPVCLVVGSSLEVFPANTIPGFVHRRFGTLAVNNLDGSGAAGADIVLRGPATEVLTKLASRVRELRGLASEFQE